ncbi:c-type cytochrome [Cognatitamlana onchidii]|uniref:c-type cytochrome n=1 Tax=Cognatitamlana onchidii TaxID=2562860 RepID=UPI0014560D35|nr:cytochrome c [Algibacter onchidii]
MKLSVISFITLVISSSIVKFDLAPQDPLAESISRGSEIYEDFCMQCHLPDGKGVENVFPPLAKSDYLMNNIEASIRGVKFGQNDEIVVNGKTYNGFMQPMGLDDDEIADVMNYVTNSWGNKNKDMITTEAVAAIKK